MINLRNHEVTMEHKLLNADGKLIEPGWSRTEVQEYERSAIKKPAFRIKEWDYYYIMSNENNFAFCITVSDLGYLGLNSVSFISLTNAVDTTDSVIVPFPMGNYKMPPSTKTGDVSFRNGKIAVEFLNRGDHRILRMDYPSFDGGKGIRCCIKLYDIPEDSMVIATPWDEDSRAFYYNQKINPMRASGKVQYDGITYNLNPETDFGGLDWGRGVWTYDNYWYWGSGSGQVDGVPFGWNIGYGFGNTSAASENMLFYNGRAHKLSQVKFHIPGGEKDYLAPWTFTSDDGRFEMNFAPVLDRASCTDVGVIKSDQHQVFGRFSGKAVLDDGKVIEVKDFPGFAEKVENKW